MKTITLNHFKKYAFWFAMVVSLFLVIPFLVSCIKFDSWITKTTTNTNTNITSNKVSSYNFTSILSGQKPNPKKPMNNFANLQDWNQIKTSKFGYFENNFVGLEKMFTVFFNIFNSNKQKEFINQFNNQDLNIFKNNFQINFTNSKNLEIKKPEINTKLKLDNELKKFFNDQIVIFESNYNSDLFFSHRSNSYFIEEYFKERKIQWEPNLKSLFSFNFLNYNFDFVIKSQDLIQKILLSIIEFEQTKQKLQSEKSKIDDQIKILKKQINRGYQPSKAESLLIQNSRIFLPSRQETEKLVRLIAKFLDPNLHLSLNSNFVFLNDFNIGINNQYFYDKILSYYNEFVLSIAKQYKIQTIFELLGSKKINLIKKYFYPLITQTIAS